ncbi:Manganese efflux system protein MneP [Oligella sp. MSHR50489EDL]|uniref:cation diffusion facilitator family transporter n=1 Tax=Oligella sp. MSHR50489EDL TaxID=3139409 RepID=UPI003D81436A
MSAKYTASERSRVANRSTFVSVLVNVLLTLLQIVFGLVTASYSLIADALHSLSDLVSDVVVLVANRFAKQKPDAKHPFGHFRFETVAVLIIAVLLFVVGAQIIMTSVERIQSGVVIEINAGLAFFIALVAILAKEFLYRYMAYEAKRVESAMLMANAVHARSDSISSLVVALGLAAHFFGIMYADLVASLIVGSMIAFMGLRMGWNALMDLADRSVDKETLDKITNAIRETPGVVDFHDLKTRKAGDFILVELHLDLPGTMTIAEGHSISDGIDARIKKDVPLVMSVLTHFDPIYIPEPEELERIEEREL